jgi:hypothetical protein
MHHYDCTRDIRSAFDRRFPTQRLRPRYHPLVFGAAALYATRSVEWCTSTDMWGRQIHWQCCRCCDFVCEPVTAFHPKDKTTLKDVYFLRLSVHDFRKQCLWIVDKMKTEHDVTLRFTLKTSAERRDLLAQPQWRRVSIVDSSSIVIQYDTAFNTSTVTSTVNNTLDSLLNFVAS